MEHISDEDIAKLIHDVRNQDRPIKLPAQNMPFITSTAFSLEGYSIEKYYGVITSNSVQETDSLAETASAYKDFPGVKSRDFELRLTNAQQKLLDQLKAMALRMGANAIIGISYRMTAAGGMLIITISGTAVKINEE